jgi:hypothetical protein
MPALQLRSMPGSVSTSSVPAEWLEAITEILITHLGGATKERRHSPSALESSRCWHASHLVEATAGRSHLLLDGAAAFGCGARSFVPTAERPFAG